MKLLSSIITLSLLAPAIAGIDYLSTPYSPPPPMSTPTTQQQTLIWTTQTLANGQKNTVQVTYSQVFPSFFTSVQVPPAGTIGLGKWASNGKVGVVKPTEWLTLTSAN